MSKSLIDSGANKMITEHSKEYYMKKFWDTVLTHAVEIK